MVTADGLLAARLLAADDVGAANTAYRRALDGASKVGLTDYAPDARWALVAAGIDDFDEAIDGAGGPVARSANFRALAEKQLRDGDTTKALSSAHEALAIALEHSALRGVVISLEVVSRILTSAGHGTEATRLFGACSRFRKDRSLVMYPWLQRLIDTAIAECRQLLPEADFQIAFDEGATLSLLDAARHSQRLRVAHTSTRVGWDALTPTEARVAELVAEGLTNAQVGKELMMGAETVKTHLSKVFGKVSVANRKELIVSVSRRAAEQHR